MLCEVRSHDEATGRSVVRLPDGTELKLRPANLKTPAAPARSKASSFKRVPALPAAAELGGRVRHGRNATVPPEEWGLTIFQYNQYVNFCRTDEGRWRGMSESTAFDKPAHIVNSFQICEEYVKPYTEGTSCGVALLLNPTQPVQPHIMLSHTWAADILETREAINDRAAAAETEFGIEGADLVVWYCLLALYQVGDMEPSIEAQVAMEPFQAVINLPLLLFMCLIITSTQDPYARLW